MSKITKGEGIVLLNVLFQLIELSISFDYLKCTSFYQQRIKNVFGQCEKELEKKLPELECLWNVDKEAQEQFMQSQRELLELLVDIRPEVRAQLVGMAKLYKENEPKFNSLAATMGFKIK